MSSDSILTMCDPVVTQADAELPVLTVLLPVPGLRRDLSGNLTDDSITTIMEGIKSLGVQIDSDATKTAVLQEARIALCRLNAQYNFLLTNFATLVSRSATNEIDDPMVDLLAKKNQDMQDILTVSRHVIDLPVSTLMEGFMGTQRDPYGGYRESFQTMQDTVSENACRMQQGDYNPKEDRSLKVSQERNEYAERLTNLYGVLNVVSIGLLFYILTT
jgi:hypothetical protein